MTMMGNGAGHRPGSALRSITVSHKVATSEILCPQPIASIATSFLEGDTARSIIVTHSGQKDRVLRITSNGTDMEAAFIS